MCVVNDFHLCKIRARYRIEHFNLIEYNDFYSDFFHDRDLSDESELHIFVHEKSNIFIYQISDAHKPSYGLYKCI